MNTNNAKEYIRLGLPKNLDPDRYTVLAAGSVLLAIPAMAGFENRAGFVFWAMIFIFGVSTVAVFVLSLKRFTIFNTTFKQLLMQAIVSMTWFLQTMLLLLFLFLSTYGWHIGLLLLYLPSTIVPIVSCVLTSKGLKREKPFSHKPVYYGATVAIGGAVGHSVFWCHLVLKDINYGSSIVLALALCMILCAIFSLGILSVQKLYYYYKLKKYNLLPEEFGQ